MGFGLNTN